MNKTRSERALELFSQQYNCAQSVFAACAVSDEMSEAQRLAVAGPFGGGVARQGEICGALTGALMAQGEASRDAMAADPVAGRKALYEQSQQLIANFRRENGAIRCGELTGCILSTEEGQRIFRELNLHENLCRKLVAFAVAEVEKSLSLAPAEPASH